MISAKNDAKDDWNVSDLVQDSTEDLSDDESCYPALTKATLIDQDSGEVYQVIKQQKDYPITNPFGFVLEKYF